MLGCGLCGGPLTTKVGKSGIAVRASGPRVHAMRNAWIVFAAASALSCAGTKSQDNGAMAGAQSPFVGQWSCPYTTNSGFMAFTKMVFTASADGMLSSTSTINTSPCSLRWTTSGSTATASGGEICGPFEIVSYTFTLDGDVAFFVAHAIPHGVTQDPDRRTSPVA